MTAAVAAIDLGATSGRVILGYVGGRELQLKHVARFPNTPVRTLDGLHWNILELWRSVTAGLRSAARDEPDIRSVAVDSWAVDYALMRDGRMLGTPYHYRDDRNTAAVERVHARVPADELYARTGLQHLPFNTLFQLEADRAQGTLELAELALLIPDLFTYWLSGTLVAERTNASTTGLLDPRTGEWDTALMRRLEFDPATFPGLVDAGTVVGRLVPHLAADVGHEIPVATTGSHDTASAVVGVPATTDDFAYVSCGTWGLVGVELERPVISDAGRAANFTNEGGVDGRIRYLHNVMGLWLLSESVREWERNGETVDLVALLRAAGEVRGEIPLFDADDPVFLAPGDMPSRIATWLREHDRPVPRTRAEFARCIVESLADAFARAVGDAARLAGRAVSVVHVVGGGAQNALLCQALADRSGRRVLAGPVEATAIGNVLVQARAAGILSGSLESMRAIVASATRLVDYSPRS